MAFPVHVLLVEDDPLIGLVSADELTRAGHRVSGPAENEREAEALARADPPDLALVDIDLEGDHEGVRLARVLHDSLGVTCLFVTGEAQAARSNADVAVGLLQKPYDARDLIASVDIVCGAAGRRPPNLELFAA